MLNKRILITAGYTKEDIDNVMTITNMSTGRLGLELCNDFSNRGYDIVLVGNKKLKTHHLFHDYDFKNKRIAYFPADTTEEMYDMIETLCEDVEFDCIIHTAAVADYTPEYTFRMEDMIEEVTDAVYAGMYYDMPWYELNDIIYKTLLNLECKVNSDTKISSQEPNLTVKLGLTPKILKELRGWAPDSVIIGFKLLDNVPVEELQQIATTQCIKNNIDATFANDVHTLRQGKHISFYCNKDGFTGNECSTPSDIAEHIYDLIK